MSSKFVPLTRETWNEGHKNTGAVGITLGTGVGAPRRNEGLAVDGATDGLTVRADKGNNRPMLIPKGGN